MNIRGKRNQRSSWWAAAVERVDWLSPVRKKAAGKSTGAATSGQSNGVKQSPKSGL